jgi:6,7-dimethyl-8-ribityllumazine synthase
MNTKFAIIVSRFNSEVTEGLLSGALAYFNEKQISKESLEIVYAPGAFEIPLIAKKLANTHRFGGVVCLGAVIKGETAHFEFISGGAAYGIMQAMLDTETPLSFGVLTTYDDEQAIKRSQTTGDLAAHNKGREAAAACYETFLLLKHLR